MKQNLKIKKENLLYNGIDIFSIEIKNLSRFI